MKQKREKMSQGSVKIKYTILKRKAAEKLSIRFMIML